MKQPFKLVLAAALLAAAFASAASVTQFYNVTSAKLKGTLNIVKFGTNPACYPGPIIVTLGAIDYTESIDFMVEPMSENAQWQLSSSVADLAPGALTFDYEMDDTLIGRDIDSLYELEPGQIDSFYEIDFTPLVQQILNSGNPAKKAYAFCVITKSVAQGVPRESSIGKINMMAEEFTTPYNYLLGCEIKDANGTYLFKYKKDGGAPVTNIYDRLQYTGNRAAHNTMYGTGCTIGGHNGNAATDYLDPEDRCSFFFHRGLAANLGWDDPLYTDTTVIAIEDAAVRTGAKLLLQTTPNPFSGSTRISYTLNKNMPVELGVYDVSGKKVVDLANGVKTTGSHNLTWNAKGLPTGIYLLRLKAGNRVLNHKMILM